MLYEAGDVKVRTAGGRAAQRSDRLIVERVLAVQLLLIVVALVRSCTEAGRIETCVVDFLSGAEAADGNLVGDRRGSEALGQVERGLSGAALLGGDDDYAVGAS